MKSFCKQKDVTKPKLQSQLSSADLFGDDEELSSDEEQVRFRQMHAENVVIYLSLFIATKSVKSKDLALQNFQCMTAPPSPALNSIFFTLQKNTYVTKMSLVIINSPLYMDGHTVVLETCMVRDYDIS